MSALTKAQGNGFDLLVPGPRAERRLKNRALSVEALAEQTEAT